MSEQPPQSNSTILSRPQRIPFPKGSRHQKRNLTQQLSPSEINAQRTKITFRLTEVSAFSQGPSKTDTHFSKRSPTNRCQHQDGARPLRAHRQLGTKVIPIGPAQATETVPSSSGVAPRSLHEAWNKRTAIHGGERSPSLPVPGCSSSITWTTSRAASGEAGGPFVTKAICAGGQG